MNDSAFALFNQKTIKRLSSQIKLSSGQIESTNQWIKWLNENYLTDEIKNYHRFSRYILEDILGYPVKSELNFNQYDVEFS